MCVGEEDAAKVNGRKRKEVQNKERFVKEKGKDEKK